MDLKGLPTDREWTEAEWKIAMARARREVEKEKREKQKARREVFDMIFPELSCMPIIWIIIGILCILFNLFTMII